MDVSHFQYWYKQPWAWFILIIFVLAILAATAMSIIALENTPAEINKHWYRDGVFAMRARQQENILNQVDAQGELTYSAENLVSFVLQYNTLNLSESDKRKFDLEVLRLYIEHPADPSQDQIVTMKRTKQYHYSATLKTSVNGVVHCLITPINDLWYLSAKGDLKAYGKLHFTPELN